MLARLFVFFGGLLVLALTAALVAPYFIDWTGYRTEFEREASAILGRSVTVKGDATARLLPFPSVTFEDVTVGGGPSGQPAMTVEEFSMDAELAPFMRGEFLIFDMRLVRPKMTVSVDADGKVDWAMRPSSPFDPAQIAIEKLTITEGQVRIRHAASGRDHLHHGDQRARCRPSRSTAHGGSTARCGSTACAPRSGCRPARSTRTARCGCASRPIRRSIPSPSRATATSASTDGAAKYAGTLRIAARDDDGGDGRRAPEQAKPAKAELPAWRVRGSFALDHARFALDEFRFETGPPTIPTPPTARPLSSSAPIRAFR